MMREKHRVKDHMVVVLEKDGQKTTINGNKKRRSVVSILRSIFKRRDK